MWETGSILKFVATNKNAAGIAACREEISQNRNRFSYVPSFHDAK
jgi:hypothetical protein